MVASFQLVDYEWGKLEESVAQARVREHLHLPQHASSSNLDGPHVSLEVEQLTSLDK